MITVDWVFFFTVGIQSAKIRRPRFSIFFFTVLYIIVMSENKTSQLGKKAKPARGGKATAKKKRQKKPMSILRKLVLKEVL